MEQEHTYMATNEKNHRIQSPKRRSREKIKAIQVYSLLQLREEREPRGSTTHRKNMILRQKGKNRRRERKLRLYALLYLLLQTGEEKKGLCEHKSKKKL